MREKMQKMNDQMTVDCLEEALMEIILEVISRMKENDTECQEAG